MNYLNEKGNFTAIRGASDKIQNLQSIFFYKNIK